MIEGLSPTAQALLGTLLTWGLTALGSAAVFLIKESQQTFLDASLGFAAGVMTAVSFWSLLAPAIEMAAESDTYGTEGQYSFVPVSIGFFLGALFVYIADVFVSKYISSSSIKDVLGNDHHQSHSLLMYHESPNLNYDGFVLKQRKTDQEISSRLQMSEPRPQKSPKRNSFQQWKRIMLMVIAITVHNFPEGLAVGVAFGAVGKSPSSTFTKAKNLAFGIGIQNFPEGMAVSLPLRSSGYSLFSAFWWGQLSGMVEPIAGMMGALAVDAFTPILPYALSFAAGAMIFVVVDDIIPEAHNGDNGRVASFWCIAGFIVMMILDVGLG